jgi:hypothetical protein
MTPASPADIDNFKLDGYPGGHDGGRGGENRPRKCRRSLGGRWLRRLLNTLAAEQHYVSNGFNEHRPTNTFDATEYLASNTDLIRGYGLKTLAAEQH